MSIYLCDVFSSPDTLIPVMIFIFRHETYVTSCSSCFITLPRWHIFTCVLFSSSPDIPILALTFIFRAGFMFLSFYHKFSPPCIYPPVHFFFSFPLPPVCRWPSSRGAYLLLCWFRIHLSFTNQLFTLFSSPGSFLSRRLSAHWRYSVWVRISSSHKLTYLLYISFFFRWHLTLGSWFHTRLGLTQLLQLPHFSVDI